jgi:nicotinate-nucleotide adenylyltransferase
MAATPIGVLGGTFDPVHNAHLRIAQLAIDVLGVGRVLWIPTGAPGYRAAPVASVADRLAMLELALAGEPRYAIDRRELAPQASGYTVDTLLALRRELGSAAGLVLLLGTDQFAKLDTWHRWRELFALAHLAVFARPGWAPRAGDTAHAELQARRAAPRGDWRLRPGGAIVPVEMPPLDISATALRAAIGRDDDVSRLLPRAVLDYIHSHHLYR